MRSSNNLVKTLPRENQRTPTCNRNCSWSARISSHNTVNRFEFKVFTLTLFSILIHLLRTLFNSVRIFFVARFCVWIKLHCACLRVISHKLLQCLTVDRLQQLFILILIKNLCVCVYACRFIFLCYCQLSVDWWQHIICRLAPVLGPPLWKALVYEMFYHSKRLLDFLLTSILQVVHDDSDDDKRSCSADTGAGNTHVQKMGIHQRLVQNIFRAIKSMSDFLSPVRLKVNLRFLNQYGRHNLIICNNYYYYN